MGRKEEEWRKRRGENKEQSIRKRNGADTVRCEEDGEEGGRMEEEKVREQRTKYKEEEWGRYSKL